MITVSARVKFPESSPVFTTLGVVVSAPGPLPWFVASILFAGTGALIGVLSCWRSR